MKNQLHGLRFRIVSLSFFKNLLAMFAVIYSFGVREEKEPQFVEAWKEMTGLIRDYEGGLGSRLHRDSDGHFIAYAQWPSREQWQKSGNNLPARAEAVRARMREACTDVRTLHELSYVEDMLVK